MPEVYLSPSPRHFNRGYGTYGTEEERMNLIADVVELELVRNGLQTERNNPSYDLQRQKFRCLCGDPFGGLRLRRGRGTSVLLPPQFQWAAAGGRDL